MFGRGSNTDIGSSTVTSTSASINGLPSTTVSSVDNSSVIGLVFGLSLMACVLIGIAVTIVIIFVRKRMKKSNNNNGVDGHQGNAPPVVVENVYSIEQTNSKPVIVHAYENVQFPRTDPPSPTTSDGSYDRPEDVYDNPASQVPGEVNSSRNALFGLAVPSSFNSGFGYATLKTPEAGDNCDTGIEDDHLTLIDSATYGLVGLQYPDRSSVTSQSITNYEVIITENPVYAVAR